MKKGDILKAMMAKEDEIEVNGIKLIIHGLSYPELIDFSELADKKKLKEAYDLLMFKTLRKAFITIEEDPEEGWADDEIKDFMDKMDGMTAMTIIQKVAGQSGIEGDPQKKLLGLETAQKK